jgi:hypothetical protein
VDLIWVQVDRVVDPDLEIMMLYNSIKYPCLNYGTITKIS